MVMATWTSSSAAYGDGEISWFENLDGKGVFSARQTIAALAGPSGGGPDSRGTDRSGSGRRRRSGGHPVSTVDPDDAGLDREPRRGDALPNRR